MSIARRAFWAATAFATATALAIGAGMRPLAAGGGQQPSSQPSADQQRPTFRAGVNLVRVDVLARAGGQPVDDLQAGDFQVREDGVAQTISTFEHVVIRAGVPSSARVEPRNVRESNQMAGDPRNRLFVLFLDTFHVTDPAAVHVGGVRMPGSTRTTERQPQDRRMGPPTFINRALARFLEGAIGPDDLMAAMTPEMDAGELTFIRKPESIEAFLETEWARRFSLDHLDPEQERWFVCYPPNDPSGQNRHRFDGIAEEMVLRQRELQTLQSLRGLVQRLGELRDERKGILLVSEGWALYRPNSELARKIDGLPAPLPPDIHVGAGGKLAPGTDPRAILDDVDWQKCETARVRLAGINDEREFRDVLDEANRSNASFYPVDPRGLAVFDTPIDYEQVNPDANRSQALLGRPSLTVDQARLRERREALETAASATDGLAMLATNDLAASLARAVSDLSDYYLIGYYSTNTKTDGSYRRIDVQVTRPGIEVRARQGYRAATAAEVAARAAAAAARPDPAVTIRERALASLDHLKVDRDVRFAGGFAWASRPDADGLARPVLWLAAELSGAAARAPEWRAGGRAVLSVMTADGHVLWDEEATVTPSSRSFVRYLADSSIASGAFIVRARVRGAPGSTADVSEQVRIDVPAASPAGDAPPGQPVLFRSGPFSGPAFQPTADARFRRAERLRVDAAIAGEAPALSARLLDRKGQPLALPVSAAIREDAYRRIASAELALAPLGPGDYLIEMSIRRGSRTDTILVPIRVVP